MINTFSLHALTLSPISVRSIARNPLPLSNNKLLQQLSKGPENRCLICEEGKTTDKAKNNKASKTLFILALRISLLARPSCFSRNPIRKIQNTGTSIVGHDFKMNTRKVVF